MRGVTSVACICIGPCSRAAAVVDAAPVGNAAGVGGGVAPGGAAAATTVDTVAVAEIARARRPARAGVHLAPQSCTHRDDRPTCRGARRLRMHASGL